ncbi:GNAT family N-acyltransferase [uncultured Roseovarius sp.]|uniref:GNAT family N-acetyltransferase n=1 Tax=uncultured Roseovarius sp. TaxID=293344 RepID=UPI000C3D76AC|nr:ornithine-acyl-ACP acyltransferase [Roseovarius sp.]MBD13303.1 ornithine-acyl-ACP acyltransferase [Roseovarius sp.]|tara:strand:+ start:3822 stop:4559 length:738 start_codon:yes stop_codon:yes gene_type:complete
MAGLGNQRYQARIGSTPEDRRAAQQLRARAFLGGGQELDCDRFDDICTHVLIEETGSGTLVCCFRMLVLNGGAEIAQSYSAQFYDLSALAGFEGKMAEMGRFCIAPGRLDPDILRVAWAAMTRFVDENGIEMLFGCSSFHGTETETYLDAFAMLRERHLAPRRWWPRVKAPAVFRFAQRLRRHKPDLKLAMRHMPPLLRTYLLMGGWVSDHAVIDRHLNTLHVFTGVEIGAIPPTRKRLLRALAG